MLKISKMLLLLLVFLISASANAAVNLNQCQSNTDCEAIFKHGLCEEAVCDFSQSNEVGSCRLVAIEGCVTCGAVYESITAEAVVLPDVCDDEDPCTNDSCNIEAEARIGICVHTPVTSFVCTGPVCGNGEVEGEELCDDGNLDNGDGCSDACSIEVVEPVCGDGTVDESEGCDDGNVVDGDGCSASCVIEVTPATTPTIVPDQFQGSGVGGSCSLSTKATVNSSTAIAMFMLSALVLFRLSRKQA